MAVAPVSTVPAPAAATPYAERRAELMRRIGPNAALLLASPPEHLRNGDTHFKFRQDSDILYLTGFEEPGTVVVLRPGHECMRFVLFVRPRDPAEETWTGRRAGVEGAVRDFGADAAFPAADAGRQAGRRRGRGGGDPFPVRARGGAGRRGGAPARPAARGRAPGDPRAASPGRRAAVAARDAPHQDRRRRSRFSAAPPRSPPRRTSPRCGPRAARRASTRSRR